MEIKVVFIGDGAVGKTSLIRSYLGQGLALMMTVGVDFYRIKYDEKSGVVIWDLGGQEHFRPFVKDFIKGAFLVILVFDLSRPDTLNNVLSFWEDVIAEVLNGVPIILVGNKKDLEERINRDVINSLLESIKKNSRLNIVAYLETSAKTGEGVKELFDKIREVSLQIISQLRAKMGA